VNDRNQAGQAVFVVLLVVAIIAVFSLFAGDGIEMTDDSPDDSKQDACFRTRDGKLVCPNRDPRRQAGGPLTQNVPIVGDECEGIAANLLDLPPELRTRNYAGGSCCHCAHIDVLNWHGFHEQADWWRANHSGGFSVSGGARIMERLGLRYAYTTNGDERLLEWASRNGHGAAIHYYSSHAITFRGYAHGYAYLCDNNRPGTLIKVEKSEFIRRWKGYGGCALTIVYSPSPPVPWQ